MEHRFTDETPDGILAGAWWQRGQITPACTWIFNRRRHTLWVTKGADRIGEYVVLDGRSDHERRQILPPLALRIAQGPNT